MSLPVSIEDLIKRRVTEDARIECQPSWDPEHVLHTICAFANDIGNDGGGYIVIGMEKENGMPKLPLTGLARETAGKIAREIPQICSLIEPQYMPAVEHSVCEGADILVLWIPGGNIRPYKCPVTLTDRSGDKAYYIRRDVATVLAEKHEEVELFLLANNIPYDDRANMVACVEDMRTMLIAEHLNKAGSSLYDTAFKRPLAELAMDMRLAEESGGQQKPLNAGLMLFNERPDNFFRYARIEVVDKPDPTGIGMTEKIFYGPLDRQLGDALSYIRNYVIREKVTKKAGCAEAERMFNYPYTAVKEALENAVLHKSYQIAEPVTVTITPDKMEITSLPGPDSSISSEDIASRKMVSARCRNRRIGDFLKALGLAGKRNTGIPAMVQAMKHNGSAPPVFKTDDERSYLTVVLPVHRAFLAKQGKPRSRNQKLRLK
ncbi:MAG: ATP-binding protein [Desulfovibrionaceae bacterium]|nr:ATP-binding protein [Desulfovibrionaceae bacterium]